MQEAEEKTQKNRDKRAKKKLRRDQDKQAKQLEKNGEAKGSVGNMSAADGQRTQAHSLYVARRLVTRNA